MAERPRCGECGHRVSGEVRCSGCHRAILGTKDMAAFVAVFVLALAIGYTVGGQPGALVSGLHPAATFVAVFGITFFPCLAIMTMLARSDDRAAQRHLTRTQGAARDE